MMKSRLSDVTIPDVTIPDVTIPSLVFGNIKQHGQTVALIDGVTGKTYSYSDLLRLGRTVASGLSRLGVRQGDVVAMISPNSPEYVIVFYAVLSLGAVVTTINPSYTTREMEYQLRDCSARYVYTVSKVADGILQMTKEIVDIKVVISEGWPNGCIPFMELLVDDGSAFPEDVHINPSTDTAAIMYSSGTTGLPKGVMLTHRNFVANVMQIMHPQLVISQLAVGDQEAAQIILGVLPFFHAFAIATFLTAGLYAGCTIITLPKFVPKTFLSAIQEYKVTIVFVVPPMVLFLLNNPLVQEYDLQSLRYFTCAAAPLSATTEDAFAKRFPKANLTQCYGMTEVLIIFDTTIGCSKYGTVGHVVSNTEVKVMDVDKGVELGVEERGELWVRGPTTLKGYLNQPEAKDAADWFRTGDVCYYDADGDFYIVDRIKELIKVKGFQVAPAELEALLLTHPEVADVGVVGVLHERNGEAPLAFIVRQPDSHVSEQELHAFVNDKVVRYKRLAGGIEFVDLIPKSPSGKILRRKLREHATTIQSSL